MSITITRELVAQLRRNPKRIVLQVRSTDHEASARALGRAREEICHLDGGFGTALGLPDNCSNTPPYVSLVLPSPGGPFIMVDRGFMPLVAVGEFPSIIRRHLMQSGIRSAQITTFPNVGPLVNRGMVLAQLPNAVGLRLYATPPHDLGATVSVPEVWIEEACSWLTEAADSRGDLLAMMSGLQFMLPTADVSRVLHACRTDRGALLTIVAGDLDVGIRLVCGDFVSHIPTVALAAGGPSSVDADLLEAMTALRMMARRLVPHLSYAFINIERTFANFASPAHVTEHLLESGISPDRFSALSDEVILDAFPYQILSRGHLERLGRFPPGSAPLGTEHAELGIGDPASWLTTQISDGASLEELTDLTTQPARRGEHIERKARSALAACLPTRDEFYDLLGTRFRRV